MSDTLSKLGTYALLLMRRLLRPLGLDLKRIGGTTHWLPVNPAMDPVTYSYFIDLRHVPTIRIKVRDVHLGIMGFAYNKAAANPFVLAFEKAVSAHDEATARSRVEALLSFYYDSVQPASACEILDLSPDDTPGLLQLSAQQWIAPWGTESLEQRAFRTRMWTVKDGLSNGRIVSAKDGLTTFGPVSQRKLDLEVKRTLKLANSIREKGYVCSDFDAPEVFGLRADGEYRWFVIRGQHRFAACAAFGIETVPARVTKIVRREDAGEWPHVVTGIYSVAGALKVFDRLFAARPPNCASVWLCQNGKFVAPTEVPADVDVEL